MGLTVNKLNRVRKSPPVQRSLGYIILSEIPSEVSEITNTQRVAGMVTGIGAVDGCAIM